MSDEETRASAAQVIERLAEDVQRGEVHPTMAASKLGELLATPADSTEQKPRRIGDVATAALASSMRRRDRAELPAPVPWTRFGEALGGGLWPGVHVVVSGTGAGKSTLCTDIALHAAKNGHHVGYVSLELDEEQIGHRFIGALTGVWWSRFTTGRQSADEHRKAEREALSLAALPIFVQTAGARGWCAENLKGLWESMREGLPAKEAATTAAPYRTPVIVVDYLQLVAAKEGARTEIRERVGQAAYEAHRLSIEYGAAVVLVSSIARGHYPLVGESNDTRHDQNVKAERRANGNGASGESRYLHDLVNSDALVGLGKESGEVEFSATTVTTMVKVPHSAADGDDKHRVLMLAKNRFGMTSWTGLRLSEGAFTEANDKAQQEISERLAVDNRKGKQKRPNAPQGSTEDETDKDTGAKPKRISYADDEDV